jgi:hypothetical protein
MDNQTTSKTPTAKALPSSSGSDHVLLTVETCKCTRTDGQCPVCDWGLGVCAICGAAESQLDEHECKGQNH